MIDGREGWGGMVESERMGSVYEMDVVVPVFSRGHSLCGKVETLTLFLLSLQNGYINFDKRRKVRGEPGLDARHP